MMNLVGFWMVEPPAAMNVAVLMPPMRGSEVPESSLYELKAGPGAALLAMSMTLFIVAGWLSITNVSVSVKILNASIGL